MGLHINVPLTQRYDASIINNAKAIRLVVFDVDGVLTDGKLTFNDAGQETKSFSVKDGQGIALLNMKGFKTAVITARSSAINEQRAKEVGIPYVFQKVKPKIERLVSLTEELGLTAEQVAYVGDDLPDCECLQWVGLACCPADAVDEVKAICPFVSTYNGGQGAVRELSDLLLKAQNLHPIKTENLDALSSCSV